MGLIDRIKPKFLVNYHSYGPLILYPQGWQVGTPDADNPIYAALAGTDATPGIPGFDPGIAADELYVTNGETTDYADVHAGSIAFTPELEEGCEGCGFVFPDDEALIQAEFEKTLPFDLDIARSATNPANPTSHLGNTVKPFYLSQTEVDPENGALAMFDFTFDKSYGDPQEVRVLAKRSLGDVTVRYQINGGTIKSATTNEWKGGERYGPGKGTYYHVVGGKIRGTKPNDSVKVWFEARGKGPGHPVIASESFTYTAVSETRNPVLILSAEDYTGASPVADPGAALPLVLRGRPRPQRDRVRRLRRRCQRSDRPGRARRPQPLRRRRLVHRRRRHHPGTGVGARERLTPGASRAARGPRLPERGRQAPVHRQVRRAPVRHRARHATLRSVRERAVLATRDQRALPSAAWLG